MFLKFHTFATILTIALFVVIVGLYLHQKSEYRHELNAYTDELKVVQSELGRRAADDCALTRTGNGTYQCKEIKSGRVFKVAVR